MGSKRGWGSFMKGMGGFGGDLLGEKWAPDKEKVPIAPAPVEDVDVLGQEGYTKKKAKERKGRASTILGSKTLGTSSQGGKTVLG